MCGYLAYNRWAICSSCYYQVPDTLAKLCLASSFHHLPGPDTWEGILYSIVRAKGRLAQPSSPGVRSCPWCLGSVGKVPVGLALGVCSLFGEKPAIPVKESGRDQVSRLVQASSHPFLHVPFGQCLNC